MTSERPSGVGRGRQTALIAGVCSLAAACASSLPLTTFDTGPSMRPEVFFSGRTSSWGVLANRSGAPSRWLTVHGQGAALHDGTFRLDQTVAYDNGKVETRTWMMHRVDDHRYEASLTDAGGPVRGEVYGNLFHLTYPLKGAPGSMEQWMYLQGDGRTVLNEASVRVLGVTVLRLSERISRDEPTAPPPP